MATALAALLAAPCAYADDAADSGIIVYQPDFFAAARPNTAFDMIKRVPGFTFDAGTTARGFAGTAGNVLIDGQRPTTKADGLDAVLLRIPAADVDHVELIRGGAPGIDMQGRTVMVNIVRKKEDSTRIVATAENVIFVDGHMLPSGSLEFTRHAGGTTYEAALSAFANYDDSVGKGYHNVFDAAGTLLTHDIAHSHGMGIGGDAKGAVTFPLFGGEFKVNALLRTSPFVDSLSYERPGFYQLFRDSSRTNSIEVGLHWNGNIGVGELETLVLQRLKHNNSISTADDTVTLQDFRALSDTGETIARATLRFTPMETVTLETGAEGAYNFLDGNTAFLINGVNQPLPAADARVEEARGEIFLNGTWKPSSQWLLEAGVRAEYSNITETGGVSQSRSFFYPKPRAVLTWSPLPDTQVRVRYEKIVGQLDFNNFIANANLSSTGVTAGNADLRPDQRTQYAISVEQHFWEKGAIVVTFMHEAITDVVDLVPVTDSLGNMFDAPGNIGDGTNDELKMELTVPLEKIGITGGLLRATTTFDFSSVKDPVTGADRWISAQRPNDIHINFSQDLPEWNSTWGLFYYHCWDEESYRLTSARFRHIAAPYVGVFWNYKPSEDWSINLEADNVWGFVYRDTNVFYTGPRNTSPIDVIDVYSAQSRPYIDITIRHTF